MMMFVFLHDYDVRKLQNYLPLTLPAASVSRFLAGSMSLMSLGFFVRTSLEQENCQELRLRRMQIWYFQWRHGSHYFSHCFWTCWKRAWAGTWEERGRGEDWGPGARSRAILFWGMRVWLAKSRKEKEKLEHFGTSNQYGKSSRVRHRHRRGGEWKLHWNDARCGSYVNM